MLLFENIGLALGAIRANISRSILTMLGIIIGVASVIGVMTLGDALDSEVSGLFSDGLDTVSVGVSEKEDDNWMGGPMSFGRRGPGRSMSDEDYINQRMIDDVLKKYSNKVKGTQLSMQLFDGAQAIVNGKKSTITLTGGDAGYMDAQDKELLTGRIFYDDDYESGRRVCFISQLLVDELYGGDYDSVINRDISVLNSNVYYTYTIVGVYKEDESENQENYGGFVDEISTVVYVPLLAAMNQTHNYYRFSQVTFALYDFNDGEAMAEAIPDYLNRRYYRYNEHYEVTGFSYISMLEEITGMINKIRYGLAAIAGISLLVGGIGVMNIMLVSITERTKEIGTRKALGATNTSIRTQFITESIVLCIVGGIIGMGVGIGLGYLGCHLAETEFVLSPLSILVSVGFSSFVGVFFGYYPANKAANMNPIDALRYE